jgi:hypothetical protein
MDPNRDADNDGYTPAQGDCDDCNPLVNPGAIQIPGDHTDYACNGMSGVVAAGCDEGKTGMSDPASLAQSMELCDARFFLGATMKGPSAQPARAVVRDYGKVMPQSGHSMAALSSGVAADKDDPGYMSPQPGTNFGNTYPNPEPGIKGAMGCGQTQPPEVNDYSELVVRLRAPTNAKSFSFDFQFFSAEYPEFVCTDYNDEFLVEMESPNEFIHARNISFDAQKNPITVNNGFFTVCQNDASHAQTKHCMHPVSDIAGTGFEDLQDGIPVGGSTGWLTTTAPVTPGEEITLRYIIFDEGDGVLDSSVVIDNFRWSAQAVDGPTTIQ